MLKTPRGILATVLLLALATASVVVGWQAWRWLAPLPDLATADREGVLRWLVLVDLAAEPITTQKQLLVRVEAVFAEDIPSEAVSSLSAEHVEQVRRNAELLKELWFHERVDGYYACAAPEQGPYLDQQIATVVRWATLDQALSRAAAAGTPRADDLGRFLVGFFDTLDRWIERAGRIQYDRIRAVVKAGLVRWLATQDLVDASPTTKQSLVRGLEKQLAGELRFGDVTDGYSPAALVTFAANVDLLAEAWFREKALAFTALAAPQRPAFLQQQAIVVEELTRYSERSPPKSPPGAVKTLSPAARIAQWIAAAPAAEQAALRQFAQQLQGTVLLRRMRTLVEPLWR